jgi:hypothetical protein
MPELCCARAFKVMFVGPVLLNVAIWAGGHAVLPRRKCINVAEIGRLYAGEGRFPISTISGRRKKAFACEKSLRMMCDSAGTMYNDRRP